MGEMKISRVDNTHITISVGRYGPCRRRKNLLQTWEKAQAKTWTWLEHCSRRISLNGFSCLIDSTTTTTFNHLICLWQVRTKWTDMRKCVFCQIVHTQGWAGLSCHDDPPGVFRERTQPQKGPTNQPTRPLAIIVDAIRWMVMTMIVERVGKLCDHFATLLNLVGLPVFIPLDEGLSSSSLMCGVGNEAITLLTWTQECSSVRCKSEPSRFAYDWMVRKKMFSLNL